MLKKGSATNNKLKIIVEMKNGSPVPAKLALEVIAGVIRNLETMEESITGKPARLGWTLTEVAEEK